MADEERAGGPAREHATLTALAPPRVLPGSVGAPAGSSALGDAPEEELDEEGGEASWFLGAGFAADELLSESAEAATARAVALERRAAVDARSWSLARGSADVVGPPRLRRVALGGGLEVAVEESWAGSMQARVWDCALVLARWLALRPPSLSMHGRLGLELGCAIGLPGLAAAALGARLVLLTERRSAMELVRRQVQVNSGLGTVLAALALEWNTQQPTDECLACLATLPPGSRAFDLILCSDLIYAGDSATSEALACTIAALTRDSPCAQVVSCFEVRHVGQSSLQQDALFSARLADAAGMVLQHEVPLAEMDPVCRDPAIRIKVYGRALAAA
jgi:predicted nicotinamide N-methyase